MRPRRRGKYMSKSALGRGADACLHGNTHRGHRGRRHVWHQLAGGEYSVEHYGVGGCHTAVAVVVDAYGHHRHLPVCGHHEAALDKNRSMCSHIVACVQHTCHGRGIDGFAGSRADAQVGVDKREVAPREFAETVEYRQYHHNWPPWPRPHRPRQWRKSHSRLCATSEPPDIATLSAEPASGVTVSAGYRCFPDSPECRRHRTAVRALCAAGSARAVPARSVWSLPSP